MLRQLDLQAKNSKYENNFILSPRIMPITAPDKGNRFLSPDLFSLVENNDPKFDNILPLWKSLGYQTTAKDRQALTNLFAMLSKTEHKLAEKFLNSPLNTDDTVNNGNRSFDGTVIQENAYKLIKTFHQLYKSVNPSQIGDLTNQGYAFMTQKQIQNFYCSNRTIINDKLCQIAAEYSNMTAADREASLLSHFLSIGTRNRSKRAPVVFGSSVLAPLVGSGSVLSPAILHPAVLSPLILSPSVLGPIILSPSIFSPVILSPNVLGGLYLTPVLADPVVLSPLVLFPIILSPIVLSPFILSVQLFVPVVLTPILLSPLILVPHVLSPVIKSPLVLSPGILSPDLLSPLIDSPIINGAKVLSPELASPHFRSDKYNFTSIASPSILSR